MENLIPRKELEKEQVQPRCALFGRCGGCQLQNLPYERQLELKLHYTRKLFESTGGARLSSVCSGMIPSPRPWYYRNKAEFSAKIWNRSVHLGFNVPAQEGRFLLEVEECPICSHTINATLRHLREMLERTPPPFPLRRLVSIRIRSSFHEERSTILLHLKRGTPTEGLREYFSMLLSGIPPLKGVQYGNRSKAVTAGETRLQEKVGDFSYTYPLHSFFQSNPAQAEAMVRQALAMIEEHAEPRNGATAVDLYCGTGLFTLPMATLFERVIGVENSREAIRYAKLNAERNGVRNVTFVRRTAEEAMEGLFSSLGALSPSLVILDPPRSGCSAAVLEAVGGCPSVRTVLMISCEPATFARDCTLLSSMGFEIRRSVLFDMFPQTQHVESMALLQRTINRP